MFHGRSTGLWLLVLALQLDAAPAGFSAAPVAPPTATPQPAPAALARIHPRALLLGPGYVWSDSKPSIATLSTLLEQAGVPFDTQPPKTDWTDLVRDLSRYALLIVPGYLEGGAVTDALRTALESFAERGGVLVIDEPIGAPGQENALALAGLKTPPASGPRRCSSWRPAPPALEALDAPEERLLPLSASTAAPLEVWTFEPEATTQILANARLGDAPSARWRRGARGAAAPSTRGATTSPRSTSRAAT